MTSYIALLRGINVAGHKLVSMPALRQFMTDLGLFNVRSLLQSGNLIFESSARKSDVLEQLLERESKKQLGLETSFFVRTAAEWKEIISINPFIEAAERDPGHLVVMCLKDAADPAKVKALQLSTKGPEVMHAHFRQIYIVYPAGIGVSKLTNALIEKKIATRGTARNWNTVMKLAAAVVGD